MTEFRIPLSAEDLQGPSNAFPLAFSRPDALRFSNDLAERRFPILFLLVSKNVLGVVNDLSFNEPSCLLEQAPFDETYIVAK